jgi:hypothetical protein
MLLAETDRRLALAEKLAAQILDPRDPARVTHLLTDILRARILATIDRIPLSRAE